MPWVRLDDRFPSHRKVALLSDRAFRLHVSAICWCAENLTDGHISDRELPLVAHMRGVKATAKQLEDAGLWDRTDSGWMIHDYLDYNPSREQVTAERKKNAERQERFRRRRKGASRGSSDGSSNAVSNAVTFDNGEVSGESKRGQTRHEDAMNAYGNFSLPEENPQVNESRNAVTNGAPTRPVPLSMADVGGSSTGSSAQSGQRPDGLAPIDADNFRVTDGMRRWAKRDGYSDLVDIDHATAQFVSHYRSTGARRSSWPDAWQKWIRDDAKKATDRQAGRHLRAVAGQTPEERGIF
ncbi:hypothetical protein TR631_12600 [Streptomyces rochei]|uniref:hypothetical protein n=1 Tax=Streptomyces rochei TaxID=1928 RepID=UPI002ACE8026|nr:hypothetical protein [Streptomyces rochei]WQC12608.1 hypothetical protein TR631_12600 [Streptomyces rochei]